MLDAGGQGIVGIHLKVLCHGRILAPKFFLEVVEQIDASAKRVEQVLRAQELTGHDNIGGVFPFGLKKQLFKHLPIVVVKLKIDRVAALIDALHEGIVEVFLEFVQLVEEQEDVVLRLEVSAHHIVTFALSGCDDAPRLEFRNAGKDRVAREIEDMSEFVDGRNPVALLQSACRDAFLHEPHYQFVL